MSKSGISEFCAAIGVVGCLYAYHRHTSQQPVLIRPQQLFTLSSPSGKSFPIDVKLIDGSTVTLSNCFSEMYVGELKKRIAVALQEPPGRIQLIHRCAPLGGRFVELSRAGLSEGSTLQLFSSQCTAPMLPAETEILEIYRTLLSGKSAPLARVQIEAWESVLCGKGGLEVDNDYSWLLRELCAAVSRAS